MAVSAMQSIVTMILPSLSSSIWRFEMRVRERSSSQIRRNLAHLRHISRKPKRKSG